MTIYDYVVLFILATSILISLIRGLVKEIFSLAGWVIAFWVAFALSETAAQFLPITDASLRLIAAFLALLLLTRISMGLITMLLYSIIEASGLKLVDRGLGTAFGLARGLLLVYILIFLCSLTEIPHQQFWQNALFRPILEKTAVTIKPFLPNSIAQYIHF